MLINIWGMFYTYLVYQSKEHNKERKCKNMKILYKGKVINPYVKGKLIKGKTKKDTDVNLNYEIAKVDNSRVDNCLTGTDEKN